MSTAMSIDALLLISELHCKLENTLVEECTQRRHMKPDCNVFNVKYNVLQELVTRF